MLNPISTSVPIRFRHVKNYPTSVLRTFFFLGGGGVTFIPFPSIPLDVICLRVLSAVLTASSSLLASLWRLFRGRKRNNLLCRVDSCGYDTSRLLLGTLVFTVLFFLTPTVAVYHTFFCIVHAVAVGVQVRVQGYTGDIETLLSRFKKDIHFLSRRCR